MGTLRKAVNLGKALFARKEKKEVYRGRRERKRIEASESKKKRNDGSFVGNDTYKNGGLKSRAASDMVIFFPQRKKMKGYERDHRTGKKKVA